MGDLIKLQKCAKCGRFIRPKQRVRSFEQTKGPPMIMHIVCTPEGPNRDRSA